MQHTHIVFGLFIPTNQNSAETVHPTVCSLDHPAPRFEASVPLDLLRLFSARTNVRRETEFFSQITHFVVVIPFVQAQVLRFVQRRPWSLDGNASEGLPRQLEIVDVRSSHRQSDGNPAALHQETSLGAGFGPIRGIRTGFFFHPAALWSWPRPCFATTSPDPSVRRTRPIRHPIVSGIRRPASIPETADEPSNWNKFLWRSTRSTDSRFAERTRSHSRHRDRFAAAVRVSEGLHSHAPATRVRQTPKTHPNIAIDSIASLHPPFRASMPEKFIDKLPVFGIGSNGLY